MSAIFAILLSLFVVKDNYIKKKYLYITTIVFIIGIILLIVYFNQKLGKLGTIAARIVTTEQLQTIFPDFTQVLVGGNTENFRERYNMDIPHNIYVYSVFSYGLIASFLLFLFIFNKGFKHIKFVMSYKQSNQNNNFRVYAFLSIFYIFIFFGRGFDYYIFDGYESIFGIFLTLIIIENYYKKMNLQS